MEQSTILTILGGVLGLAFVLQALMEGRRRAVPQLIGLGLVIAAIGGFLVYRHGEQVRQRQALVVRRAEFESQISVFSAKHNAERDWQKSLLAGKPNISELTPLLVRPDGRPILVVASLLSLSQSDGQTLVYLDEADRPHPQFKLQLDCTPDQAHFLVSDGGPYFAVIAQIRSVDYAGDYSLARGRCVDLMPVSLSDYFELVIGPQLDTVTE